MTISIGTQWLNDYTSALQQVDSQAIAQTKKPSREKAMDGTEITSVVNRIAILSDLRDWEGVRQCFTDQVAVDYTSLTGGQPETIAADALVQSWNTAFSNTFKTTQHLLGTHAISIEGDTATCISHLQARHVALDSTKGVWTLGGHYHHDLVKTPSGWRVRSIKMTWTWEEGTRP
jgi:ketosteroid isomerase-like protein